MEGRKFFLALGVCAAIVVLHQVVGNRLWPKNQEKEQPTAASENGEGSASQTVTPSGSVEPATQNGGGDKQPEITSVNGLGLSAPKLKTQQGLPVETITLGSRSKGSGYWLELLLTTDDGGMPKAWLTEFAGDSEEYKYSESPYGQGRRTPLALLNPVEGRAESDEAEKDEPPIGNSLATSRLRLVKLKSEGDDADERMLGSADLVGLSAEANSAKWQGRKIGQGEAKFDTTIQVLGKNGGVLGTITLVKTYRIRKNSYDVDVELELTASKGIGRNLAVEIVQDGPTGLGREDLRTDMRSGIYGQVVPSKGGKRISTTMVPHKTAMDAEKGVAVSDSAKGDLLWAGTMNKFFGAFLVPESRLADPENLEAPEAGSVFKRALFVPIAKADGEKSGNVLPRLVAPYVELTPGRPEVLKLKLFLGPKERKLLKSGQYGRLGFAGTIQYMSCFKWLGGILTPVSLALLWLMAQIYRVIPNYGVSIILLVAMVRVALHHFSKTSQASMVRMQKLAPELEKLKSKYGNNKEEFGRAQMALYKQHGVNPITGCLPMFFQMPIWIALFSALNSAVELRHAAFFGWINNLSGPDNITAYFGGGLPDEPLWTIPLLNMPIWGLNILPVLLGLAFFLQQKFSPTASSGSAQAEQTKKMMALMIWIFPVMLYNSPSGLTLYIMTSTFVGLIENHFIKKHIREQDEAANRPVTGGKPDKVKTFRLKK